MTPGEVANVFMTALAALAILRRIEVLEARLIDHEGRMGRLEGRKA
jgi:hypothetical protein